MPVCRSGSSFQCWHALMKFAMRCNSRLPLWSRCGSMALALKLATAPRSHEIEPAGAVQLHSRPEDLAALAQWLTQRHDAATKLQGTQLDALYRLLSAAADLDGPGQQVTRLISYVCSSAACQ